MDVATPLKRIRVEPEDILSAARTIPANNANGSCLNGRWILPSTFLAWAQRGFKDGDEYGLANAITYAKRATASRIDRLIRNYHLSQLHRDNFPRKIKVLEDIGIRIPSVIQELVIEPRNQLEHDYIPADADVARRAIDIASLFLNSTDEEDRRESIIALNMNILYSDVHSKGKRTVTFKGWSGKSMLFIDVFDDPQCAKIVDSENGELLYATLSAFTNRQAIEFAKFLRSHFSLSSHGLSNHDSYFFIELKKQAGF